MTAPHFLILLLFFAALVAIACILQARTFRRRVWEPLRDTFGCLQESEWSSPEWRFVHRTRAAGTFSVWDNRLRWRYDAVAQRLILRPALRSGPCIAVPCARFAVRYSDVPDSLDVIIATGSGEVILTVPSSAAGSLPPAN